MLRPDSAIRPGTDADAAGFIALIGACWSEYPGVVMDVDAELPELHALASYYTSKGGALWAAEAAGQIVGMIATSPHGDNAWEIGRLYVLAPWRASGLAQRLLDLAEAYAVTSGAARVVLWSDTRFDRAHRFYEKRSYVRCGPIRVLQDISKSLEFAYAKPVSGVELLDAAGAASAGRRLSEILCACVDAGASAAFLPPLAPDVARGFWRRAASDVAVGARIILAGWMDAILAGVVTLELTAAANQPHHAEVQTLLVHPDARRRGLARALMLRAEQAARQAGRSLLTLDTRAGDATEALVRSMDWQQAGRIPGYTRDAAGTPSETVFFWKHID